MHVNGFNENIPNILSSLDNSIKVLIVSAADTEAFAAICYNFFILNNTQNFNHLLKKIWLLESRQNSLVLSEATSQATNQILHEKLGLLLN